MTASNVAAEFEVPEEKRRLAQRFFDRGKAVADTGSFDFAIEMYIQGLAHDPEAVDAHQALRDISMRRKANGGKPLGMLKAMQYRKGSKDDRQNLLNAEMLLAYDPGETSYMLTMLQAAQKSSFRKTIMWLGPILLRANADSKKPDFNKFLALRDIYVELGEWRLATEACQKASQLRPNDMDLLTVLKNLGAQETMTKGRYEEGGGFTDSIKDRDKQEQLMREDTGVRSQSLLERNIVEAEAEYKADPNEPGKLMKLVEALARMEDTEYENRAIELLDTWYKRTKQFRFRFTIGKIKLAQLNRMERSLKSQLQADPTSELLKAEVTRFTREKLEEELKEFSLSAENYPTDMRFRHEVAVRLFLLERYDEAIPAFQQARADPKLRTEALVYLGRAFLQANFLDEASDTFKGIIEEYQLKGDNRSKEMYYWYGRTLEGRNEKPAAIKAYSQVAQWDFNYRDVQVRIKKLRTAAPSA